MTRLKRARGLLSGNLFSILAFLIVLGIFINGLRQASSSQKKEALRVAKESVMRAVISCYATEGSYPESYEYLQKNYGVSINEDKYAVFYEAFASNMMPDITIIER